MNKVVRNYWRSWFWFIDSSTDCFQSFSRIYLCFHFFSFLKCYCSIGVFLFPCLLVILSYVVLVSLICSCVLFSTIPWLILFFLLWSTLQRPQWNVWQDFAIGTVIFPTSPSCSRFYFCSVKCVFTNYTC